MRSYLYVTRVMYKGLWVSLTYRYPQFWSTCVDLTKRGAIYYKNFYCPYFKYKTHSQKEVIVAKYIKRATDAAKGKSASSVPKDAEFSKRYPAMWEHMTERFWEPGKPRETATVTIFTEADEIKGVFNDKANHRTAFVSADTFQGLLEALEQGLQEDSLDWRNYDPSKSKFKR